MSLHTSGSYHLNVSSLGSLSPPPHSPNYPSIPIPSFLHCYMICSKSSPEGGLHHHPRSPSPGGWRDNLSAPPPTHTHTHTSCRRHSSRFHSPRSLPFFLPLILFPLMWGLSFSSSLASLGAPRAPPLSFSSPLPFCLPVSSFLPSYILLVMRGLWGASIF